MAHYYNEFDPETAAMLRQLMLDGVIPEGDVDERSITEVSAADLRGYIQCHFFAGIGGWPIALRIAGWPEDRSCWTGSAPCQPYSLIGKQKGFDDPRDLYPVWERLIIQCKPPVVFGEQVKNAIAKGWLDRIYQGMEPEGYAVGAALLPAVSVGAPHIRDRLFFSIMDNCFVEGLEGHIWDESTAARREIPQRSAAPAGFWDDGQFVQEPRGENRFIEPSIPLVDYGVQYRRPILHAIGNAIVPQVAAEFIKALM